MKDLIGRIASAIAVQEGAFSPDPSVPPRRDNNPGDMTAAPWILAPKMDGRFWHAGSLAQGIAGEMGQIIIDIRRGWSLRQLIHSWSPPNENNTDLLVTEAARRIGLTAEQIDQPLWNFLEIEHIP
jgi:hypothetical protein